MRSPERSPCRITTSDGREGFGQLSSFEPDITATVLHRQVARHVLGSDPAQMYDSLVNKLKQLPENTVLYPGHNYSGQSTSTIGEEKLFNPFLTD